MNGFATMIVSAALLFASPNALAQDAAPQSKPAPTEKPEPKVPIRFEGFLPGTAKTDLEGTFKVEFRIYVSPQGGQPIWKEAHTVKVVHGRMDVTLGETTPIPMKVHETTFKFVGASVEGGREVYPRFPVVNTVFVSPTEARVAKSDDPNAQHASHGDGDYETKASSKLIAAKSEAKATWREALEAARAAGADLPDYADWYAALERCGAPEADERSGHYEWVLPWVYDTASHGTYNRYFRGRLQGCDYSDLAPTNSYVYRLARAPAKTTDEKAAKN